MRELPLDDKNAQHHRHAWDSWARLVTDVGSEVSQLGRAVGCLSSSQQLGGHRTYTISAFVQSSLALSGSTVHTLCIFFPQMSAQKVFCTRQW